MAKRRTSGNFFEPETLAANPTGSGGGGNRDAVRHKALSVKWVK